MIFADQRTFKSKVHYDVDNIPGLGYLVPDWIVVVGLRIKNILECFIKNGSRKQRSNWF